MYWIAKKFNVDVYEIDLSQTDFQLTKKLIQSKVNVQAQIPHPASRWICGVSFYIVILARINAYIQALLRQGE